jgi:hypothetical protein
MPKGKALLLATGNRPALLKLHSCMQACHDHRGLGPGEAPEDRPLPHHVQQALRGHDTDLLVVRTLSTEPPSMTQPVVVPHPPEPSPEPGQPGAGSSSPARRGSGGGAGCTATVPLQPCPRGCGLWDSRWDMDDRRPAGQTGTSNSQPMKAVPAPSPAPRALLK